MCVCVYTFLHVYVVRSRLGSDVCPVSVLCPFYGCCKWRDSFGRRTLQKPSQLPALSAVLLARLPRTLLWSRSASFCPERMDWEGEGGPCPAEHVEKWVALISFHWNLNNRETELMVFPRSPVRYFLESLPASLR